MQQGLNTINRNSHYKNIGFIVALIVILQYIIIVKIIFAKSSKKGKRNNSAITK